MVSPIFSTFSMIDPSTSASKGHEWCKSIYCKRDRLNIAAQAAIVRERLNLPFVDPKKKPPGDEAGPFCYP